MEIVSSNERDIVNRIRLRLIPYFYIESEQWGTHWSGKRLRIDMIIRPRIVDGWKRSDIMFGVECKKYGEETGKTTRHFSQCVAYSDTIFDCAGGSLIPILSAPSFIPSRIDVSTRSWLERFAGQLNVGELKCSKFQGVHIHHTGHLIWGEKTGVYEGRRWSLCKRIGSDR
jgi:hypothetical protein